MDPGCPQQIQSVGFRLCQRLFMTEYDSGVIILQTGQPDEAPPLHFCLAIRHAKALRVGIQRGLGILQEDALATPVAEVGVSTGINIVIVAGFGLPLS